MLCLHEHMFVGVFVVIYVCMLDIVSPHVHVNGKHNYLPYTNVLAVFSMSSGNSFLESLKVVVRCQRLKLSLYYTDCFRSVISIYFVVLLHNHTQQIIVLSVEI